MWWMANGVYCRLTWTYIPEAHSVSSACLHHRPHATVHQGKGSTFPYSATSSSRQTLTTQNCVIVWQFPATQVVFCKNGLEEFSLKAQQGRLIYALVLNITSRSAGTYMCGYQQKNKKNYVRNSALSAPWTFSVAGAGETTTDIQSSPGACRGRCPRQQQVDSPQTEDASYGDIQYFTIAHIRRDRPRPMHQMRNIMTYATVTHTQTEYRCHRARAQEPCPQLPLASCRGLMEP
ncbi:uncharacterized protein [Anas acuta]|uniref:uncharacterized protein isoform X2 n=1 Tax=Anas acuta TaxID=28680 RepID=UPI0035C8D94D